MEDRLKQDLVLHYTFNQNGAVLADKSGHHNDGAVQGAAFTPKGLAGGAYTFDGNGSLVNAGHDPSLSITSNLTLSAWFKKRPKTFGAPHQLQVILGKDDAVDRTGRSYMLYMFDMPDVNRVCFSYGVQQGGVDGRHDLEAFVLPVSDGRWYHVVVVHETGIGNKLYVDGALAAEDEEGSPLPSNPATDMIVGKTKAWEPWYFFGVIDEVRIYSRGLSAREVRALYNDGM